MFWEKGNRDTSKAIEAHKRPVAVRKGSDLIGHYPSLKACSEALGVPCSKICMFAKSKRIYRGGLEFMYV